MALESEFGDNAQLRDCAVRDPAHVSETANKTGQHVVLIKKALSAWLARRGTRDNPIKGKPPLPDLSAGELYDKLTADLVEAYKTEKGIKNHQGRIDRVVGKKTVEALDKELPKKSAGREEAKTTTIDVVVRFSGTLKATVQPLTDEVVLPRGRAAQYEQNGNSILNKLPKNPLAPDVAFLFTPRRLIRIGTTTNQTGADGKPTRDGMLRRMLEEKGTTDTFGKVFVYGSSSGGRNAIDFASELKSQNIDVEYLAALDPAFFPNETTDQPVGLFGEPTNVPNFTIPRVPASAVTNKVFFQTVGNHRGVNIRARAQQFTSEMSFEEIHGNIPGFTPMNLTSAIAIRPDVAGATGKARDDNAHIALSNLASGEAQSDIARILNGL